MGIVSVLSAVSTLVTCTLLFFLSLAAYKSLVLGSIILSNASHLTESFLSFSVFFF